MVAHPSPRDEQMAKAWLKERKKENDPHGGLMPRRLYPPNTLAESLAELLAEAREEQREHDANIAEQWALGDGAVSPRLCMSIAATIRNPLRSEP